MKTIHGKFARSLLAAATMLACSPMSFAQLDELDGGLFASPSAYTTEALESLIRRCEWEQKKAVASFQTLADSRGTFLRELQKIEKGIEDSEKRLPSQVRFLDIQSRSMVVGYCVRKLLETNLELAAKNAMIKQLREKVPPARTEAKAVNVIEKSPAKTPPPNKDTARADVAAIQLQALSEEVVLQHQKVSRLRNLISSGVASENDYLQAKIELSRAEGMLAQRKAEADLAMREPDSKSKAKLADLEIEVAALSAQAEAANRFLETLAETAAAERNLRIDRFKREQAEARSKSVEAEMTKNQILLDQLRPRLELLKDALKNRAETEASKKKTEKKDENPNAPPETQSK